jgi:FkbM family methyltransferase
MFLNLRESPMMRARALNIYEYEKVQWFHSFLEPGMTVLDIGANKGYFSLLSARLMNDEGTVHSFEPEVENCKWLRESIEANGYTCISVFEVAAFSDHTKRLLHYGHKSGHHSIVTDKGLGECNVFTRTLDSLIPDQQYNRVDIIKIDVEGAEQEVLEGAREMIAQFSPILFIDIHENVERDTFFDLVDQLGYRLYTFTASAKEELSKDSFITNAPQEVYAERGIANHH